MKHLLTMIVFLLAFYNSLHSSEQAERLYKEGKYKDATRQYEQLLAKSPNNVEILYNLGNTAYKSNQFGKSIFYYMRAKQLNPRDADINKNLKLALERRMDQAKSLTPPFYKKLFGFTHFFSINEWAATCLFFLMALNISLFIWIFKKHPQAQRAVVTVTAILIVFLPLFIGKAQSNFWGSHGIVIEKKIAIKSGPSENLETLFFIHEGTQVKRIQTVSGWSEVRLENGLKGWIQETGYWAL